MLFNFSTIRHRSFSAFATASLDTLEAQIDVPILPPRGLLPPPLIVSDVSKRAPSSVTTRRNSLFPPYAIRVAWKLENRSYFKICQTQVNINVKSPINHINFKILLVILPSIRWKPRTDGTWGQNLIKGSMQIRH